jgi:tRNA A37 threonylcarbamoyladenosine modification protein TsaB
VPVVGVSSLAAIANRKAAEHVVAYLPALAGEMYYRIGDASHWGSKIQFDQAITRLRRQGKRVVLATGTPHIRDIAELGIKAFLEEPDRKKFFYAQVHPLYLQPSWAERSKPR